MNRFIIIEIGSTNTKTYLFNKGNITDLGFKTIEFKNHYKKENKIDENDKRLLFDFINAIEEENIFVFGTSIFRDLSTEERKSWLKEFKENTNLDFQIVTSDMENELTVHGATANIEYNGKIAVMVAGGGSTELSIVENKKIIEKCNYSFGTCDVTEKYPDLKEDYVKNDYEEMLNYTKGLIDVEPKNKADFMILAGGDFIYFFETLNYPLENNKFYESDLQPYCLDTNTMLKCDRNYFYNISLEKICKETNKDDWWRGTRGMRLCVKSLVDVLNVQYIIPTRISMVYGLVEKIKQGKL